MSWFEYGSLTGRKRNLRKGVWLRVRTLPEELQQLAKPFMHPEEEIDWVIVKEMHEDSEVLLEFWCVDASKRFVEFARHGVFYIKVKEDPNWICEGDLGRGYKE